MAQSRMALLPAFIGDALVASQVGTWECDVSDDCMRGDAVTARLFGLDEVDAAHGLSVARFVRNVHPEDNERAEPLRRMMREHGGNLLFEMRMLPEPGVTRWALIRGAYERDAAGDMLGRGVAIDVTMSKLDGNLEVRSFITAERADIIEPQSALDEAVGHALAAYAAIERIDGVDRAQLLQGVEALLWAMGRAIARASNE